MRYLVIPHKARVFMPWFVRHTLQHILLKKRDCQAIFSIQCSMNKAILRIQPSPLPWKNKPSNLQVA
jgi:hypothetical protein